MERRSRLERRTPLAQRSAKRQQRDAEQGNPNPFSTLTNCGVVGRGNMPRPAAPAPRRPRDTGPTAETVAVVWGRDAGRCVRCGGVLTGTRGLDWSVQHRRARGAGGTRRQDTNQPQALILLCGSATTGCHLHVESFRDEARRFGWAIRQTDNSSAMPVLHALHGWVLLDATGGYASAETTREHDDTEGSAMAHQARYLALQRRTLDLWSVGCTCGWLCEAPLRGSKDRARAVWRAHRSDVETRGLARLMTETPRGGKAPRLSAKTTPVPNQTTTEGVSA